MDFSDHWNELLSINTDILGGAVFSTDGVIISAAKFGRAENRETAVKCCAAAVALVYPLFETTERGEFEVFILKGELGYVLLMPILDKTIFAVSTHKYARLGLVMLDMRRLIADPFGPGLAAEPIFPPHPPKHGTARAKPDHD